MNGWAKVRDFINGKEVGHIFARKDLLLLGHLSELASSSVDMIRNTLVRSGFLKIVGRGKYEFMTKIPSGSTLSELKTLAFKSKLEYLEQVVGRKEREKGKKPKCECPIYCRFCGARLKRDTVGHFCPQAGCQWQHGADCLIGN